MARSEVPFEDVIATPRPVYAQALNWPESHEENWHFHNRGQLLYASSGIMDVATTNGTHVVPPQRALWLPAGVAHKVRANTALSFRTVYIDQDAASWLPRDKSVFLVRPLLKELILAAVEVPPLYQITGRENRIMTLLVDEIAISAAEQLNLFLPNPKDRRIATLVKAIKANPTHKHSAEGWAKKVGASSRTIDRIFRAETGMSFEQWKRQAILLEALRTLSEGKSVTNVALDLGYESPSAFVAMFRRTLGTTPGKLFS